MYHENADCAYYRKLHGEFAVFVYAWLDTKKRSQSIYASQQIIQSHHTHIDPTALRMQHHHQGPLRDVLGWSRRLALPYVPANARKDLACEERKKAHESNNSELQMLLE